MKWFGRKPRRPRGPHTPQALALNWRVFLDEAEQKLRSLGVPSTATATQEAFERFLDAGKVGDETWQPKADGDEDELRALIWQYRSRTSRHLGASFLEREDAPSRYTAGQLLRELEKSSRWGTNDQPADIRHLAGELSTLPLFSAEMRRDDALVLRFLRPLTDEEANRLLQAVGLVDEGESPFVANEPKLEAHCWWD